MAGYSRQSSGDIATGNTIEAAHFNDEFDQLEAAFDATTGHAHDGSSGNGPKISLTSSVSGTLPITNGGTGATTQSEAQISLGLEIDTDVQAYDAGLASIAGLTTAADKMIYTTASDTYAVADLTSFARTILDDSDAATVRTTIGAQTLDAGLTSISGLTTAADKMIYTTASDTYAVTDLTSFARSLLDDTTSAAARSTLGVAIGTDVQAYDAGLASISGLTTAADKMIYTTASDTYAVTDLTSFARSLLDDSSAATARTTLGVAIGTNVQAYDAGLQSISGLTTAADRMIYTTASDTYAVTTLTSFARSLLDDSSSSVARSTLGLVIGTDVQAYSSNLASINQDLGTTDTVTFGTLQNVTLKDLGYTTASVATALDFNNGNIGTKTTSGNTTFTFANVPAGVSSIYTLELTLGGAHTITWPGTVDWGAAGEPSLSSGGEYVITFLTTDGGTSFKGMLGWSS